jgi:dTDP-glucose 4,6-dehydratase
MVLLVTGAAGFIGTNFVNYYLKKNLNRRVIGLDKLTYAGNVENFKCLAPGEAARFTFVKGDINDSSLVNAILREHQVNQIIHFAAESHVDRSITDPHVFIVNNVLGTHTLLDCAKRCWYSNTGWRDGVKFLQVSTDEVYGSLGPTGFFTEQTPLAPNSPYSASKAGADLMVRAYHHTYGMPTLITRCSNNYGPFQYPEKLIPVIFYHALHHLKIPVYGDGEQIRDWLYVEDHCRALDMVLQDGRAGEVYNIGGHNEMDNLAIVKTIIRILREKTGDNTIEESLIDFVMDRPGHDRRYGIDPTKIGNEIGWIPSIPFDQGIDMTIDWYLSHRSWIDQVLAKMNSGS